MSGGETLAGVAPIFLRRFSGTPKALLTVRRRTVLRKKVKKRVNNRAGPV